MDIQRSNFVGVINNNNSDLQILGVINVEELANDREEWGDVVVVAKGLNGLILSHGRKGGLSL